MSLAHANQREQFGKRIGQHQAIAHKLVTTPAYMFDDARLSDVFVGIERCVAEVLKRVS